MKKETLKEIVRRVIKEESSGEQFQIGDYIRKINSSSGGHKSVTNGYVYWVHPTGNWVKLEDQFGNKEARQIDVKGFKKIKKSPTRQSFS